MPFPSLHDDGSTVVLDLHGARVEEARQLTTDVLREAFRRGRTTVRVIHGHSTSGAHPGTRTIKQVVQELLEHPPPGCTISSAWRTEGAVVVALPAGRTALVERLQLRDFWPA